MQIKSILESIISSGERPSPNDILDLTLPRKDGAYSIEEVESRLHLFRDEIEDLQRDSNNQFEISLGKDVSDKLQNLYQRLHNVQLDIMKLQCEIAFTKEKYDAVNVACNNSIIRERREMLITETNLRKTLQQSKFEPIKEFFDRFATFLVATVTNCSRIYSYNSANYLQFFDWTHYHSVMFLLRACGKAFIDLDRFERLYQSDLDIVDMTFKQPIDQIDFKNFLELQESYNLESNLEITLRNRPRDQEFKDFLTDPNIEAVLTTNAPLNYLVFESLLIRFKSINVDCCKLLVDLNMNYIEAHLTDGINIDKLNGGDDVDSSDQQPLPLYAVSPQEYIIQIGQHLLTLRKQTDQFDSIGNESLKYALESLKQAQDDPIDAKVHTTTDIVMRCIARHCIRSLLGRTSNSIVSKLTPKGRRQLATDALYLDNVLEDLGLLGTNEPNIEKFKGLLIL